VPYKDDTYSRLFYQSSYLSARISLNKHTGMFLFENTYGSINEFLKESYYSTDVNKILHLSFVACYILVYEGRLSFFQ
jgi:hypothetical protein